jgi:outer membrane autotransporter protein
MYYLLPESKIHPFIQAGFGYANVSQEMSIGAGDTSVESFNGNAWGVGIGVAFMLGDKISLDLNLEYAEVNARYSDDSTIKFQTKGLGALIGFSIYL